MKQTSLIFWLLAVLLCSCGWVHAQINTTNFMLGGIQVNEPDYERWTSTIKDVGMNTVEVTVYAKQGPWDSDLIWWEDTEPAVINEIVAAKKAGLKVVLILRIALDHYFKENKFLWHGMIAPRNDYLLESWFNKYEKFVTKWGEIATQHDLDMLVIGSELNALSATIPILEVPEIISYYADSTRQSQNELRILKYAEMIKEKDMWVQGFSNYSDLNQYTADRIQKNMAWADQVSYGMTKTSLVKMNRRRDLLRKRWQQLIAKTRKVYPGKLSYAANFDNYADVDFWSDLDCIGINGYFPLCSATQMDLPVDSLRGVLEQSWTRIFDRINRTKTDQHIPDMPVVFTELGYVYKKYATVEPWKGFGFSIVGTHEDERLILWNEEKVDRNERAMAVNALYNVAVRRNENIAGILYWKLTSFDYHIPIEPFVLHINRDKTDPLQESLVRFVKGDPIINALRAKAHK